MATFSPWARWGSENGNKLYLAITESLLRANSSAAALSHSTLQYCSVISNWVISNRFWMRSDIRGALQRTDLSTESSSTSEVHGFIRLVEICHCLMAEPWCVAFPPRRSPCVSQSSLRFSSYSVCLTLDQPINLPKWQSGLFEILFVTLGPLWFLSGTNGWRVMHSVPVCLHAEYYCTGVYRAVYKLWPGNFIFSLI